MEDREMEDTKREDQKNDQKENGQKENNQKIEAKRHRMLEEPVESLVPKMAVPTIISMLITAFYNLADTFFVGQLGSNAATGAVGIIFSYMALVQAIGFFFGQGSGNYISRAIGSKDFGKASKMAATGFFLALFTGIVLGAVCFLFRTTLVQFLGATPTMMEDAVSYFVWILVGTPWMMASLVLNNQLRLQGNAVFGMAGLVSGAVLNIIGDPVLIFGFHMGVSGAALATILSQLASFIILLWGVQHSSNVSIQWKNFSPSGSRIKEMVAGGLPSLGRQGLGSIAMLLLNRFAGFYGDEAIAAFTVVTKVVNIASSVVLGFGQGFQPVCGFNFGAGRMDRVKKAFWFGVRVTTIVVTVISVLAWIFAPQIIQVFRDDPEVIAIGTKALRYQMLITPLVGFAIMTNMFLQNIGDAVPATLVATSRQGWIFLPLLFIFMYTMGLFGLEITQPVSDALTFVLCIPLALRQLKRLDQWKEGE